MFVLVYDKTKLELFFKYKSSLSNKLNVKIV